MVSLGSIPYPHVYFWESNAQQAPGLMAGLLNGSGSLFGNWYPTKSTKHTSVFAQNPVGLNTSPFKVNPYMILQKDVFRQVKDKRENNSVVPEVTRVIEGDFYDKEGSYMAPRKNFIEKNRQKARQTPLRATPLKATRPMSASPSPQAARSPVTPNTSGELTVWGWKKVKVPTSEELLVKGGLSPDLIHGRPGAAFEKSHSPVAKRRPASAPRSRSGSASSVHSLRETLKSQSRDSNPLVRELRHETLYKLDEKQMKEDMETQQRKRPSSADPRRRNSAEMAPSERTSSSHARGRPKSATRQRPTSHDKSGKTTEDSKSKIKKKADGGSKGRSKSKADAKDAGSVSSKSDGKNAAGSGGDRRGSLDPDSMMRKSFLSHAGCSDGDNDSLTKKIGTVPVEMDHEDLSKADERRKLNSLSILTMGSLQPKDSRLPKEDPKRETRKSCHRCPECPSHSEMRKSRRSKSHHHKSSKSERSKKHPKDKEKKTGGSNLEKVNEMLRDVKSP